METLNAIGLTPISVFSDRRSEPRKTLSPPTTFPFKFPNSNPNPPNFQVGFSNLSRSFGGGLVLLSSFLNSGFSRALTYEEATQQSVSATTLIPSSDFDFGGFVDDIVNFAVDNPVVVAGGVAIVAVPLVVSQVFSNSKPFGVKSAKNAYAKLGDDESAQLLDIRAPSELRQVGVPDVRGLRKKPVALAYKGKDKPRFLKKLSLKFKEPENTTLFILDKFDGNSELVAELVTSNGFKAAYAIKDGAEGARGWMNSGLPWILPKKTLSLDFSNLTDAIGEGAGALPVALGFAAAAGLGLLAFSEVETILQVLGSAALLQVVSKNLLFAEDRKQTLQLVDEFLSTKIAPKEFVGDITQIGKALLPSSDISKALPAPGESSPATTENTVQKAEAVAEPPKVEAVAEPTPQINSVPNPEVKTESLPGFSRPLSPYPFYPDFKPPTSPTPSQP